MLRLPALILLVLLSACASRTPVPLATVGSVPAAAVDPADQPEPVDPAIKPLSTEMEEKGQ